MTIHPSPSQPPSFLGAWLVQEYVYNPDGTFAGTVQQRRELVRQPDGRIRVTQHCQPGPELAGHPMGRFTGTPVFDLTVAPPYRHYHGPAVIGTAITWSDGVMTGQGIWPEFGHNFRSFTILTQPARQLTGGKFSNASQMVANIIGLVVPEEAANGWPTFSGPHWPGELAQTWVGTAEKVRVSSLESAVRPLHRRYLTQQGWQGWQDEPTNAPTTQWQLTADGQRWRVSGNRQTIPLHGIGKQFGWLLEIEAVVGFNHTVMMMELLDAAGNQLIGLRHWLVDNQLFEVEITRLQPG
ncbi:MAG: hypothetical protein KJ063_19635 [Anaerolineae bacterium]|nr:hypothetical protein [Anaerolineae bacterium]